MPTPIKLFVSYAHDDEPARIAALEALAQASGELPETPHVLGPCAVEDKDGDMRAMALYGLAEQFRDAPGTRPLLARRAVEDEDSDVRARVFRLWFSRGTDMHPRLLARDLDGTHPGLDPRNPITFQRVADAASALRLSEDEVRTAYERMADEFPALRLEWREASARTKRTRGIRKATSEPDGAAAEPAPTNRSSGRRPDETNPRREESRGEPKGRDETNPPRKSARRTRGGDETNPSSKTKERTQRRDETNPSRRNARRAQARDETNPGPETGGRTQAG